MLAHLSIALSMLLLHAKVFGLQTTTSSPLLQFSSSPDSHDYIGSSTEENENGGDDTHFIASSVDDGEEFELGSARSRPVGHVTVTAGHGHESARSLLRSDDEDQEPQSEYEKGGYHPVKIGDIFNGTYEVIRKLGSGYFSTVWLCKEENKTNGPLFALKIIKSAKYFTDAAKEEIKLLEAISNGDSADPHRHKVVQLLDHFIVSGENGNHVCMVFEFLGINLEKYTKRGNSTALDVEKVRSVIRQMLEGLAYIHKCGIIHSDIKQANVLVTMTDDGDIKEVKIADLGNACWSHVHSKFNFETRNNSGCALCQQCSKCIDVVTGSIYKAPEVLLGAGYGTAADIWSMACLAFELATGEWLFNPEKGPNYTLEDDHLAHIVQLLGPIPPTVYKRGSYWKRFYDKHGKLLHRNQLKPLSMYEMLQQKFEWNDEDALQFTSFLTPMFEFDQYKRATAAQCLQHDWLKPFGGRPQPVSAAAAAAAEEEEKEEGGSEE